MNKSLLFFLSLLLMFQISTFAQKSPGRNCGTMSYLSDQLQKDPTLAERMNQIEQQATRYIANRTTATSASAASTVVIPVVFHVLYNTTAQNISDAQCISQLNQLNKDFAKLNSDTTNIPTAFKTLAANTNIQFCLAQRDPNGAATTGIIHKSTTTTSFSSDDKVKYSTSGGDNAWPSTSYLNLWVCNLGGGLLGYAQFPGGAAATDGVVLIYTSVGSMQSPSAGTPYNLGRTATHEVGHWLNLRHIWGDANCGDDLVGDTPTQQTSNYGCPTFPRKTCSNTTNGDMFMNYMDYVDDGCMNMFSVGQSTRMNALFATGGSRIGLLSSLGCQPVSATACGATSALTATSITSSGATLNWTAVTGASSYNVQYRIVGSATWTTTTSTTNSKAITGLTAASNYEFQVQTVCTSGSSAFTTSATFTTATATSSCGATTGLTSSLITTTTATLTWTAVTGASSYNVQYRKVGTTTWTATTSTTNSKAITGLTAASNYEFQVQTVCKTGSSAFTTSATFTTLAATSCISTYDNTTNGTTAGAALIPFNTNITGLINVSTDIDYYKFTITKAGTITITLTTLPADYDLSLFNSAGTQVATSAKSSTTSESISYTAAIGTYYVKVFGYGSVFNATSCYTAKVQLGTATRQENQTNSSNEFVKIFPNPTHEHLQISLKNNITRGCRYTIIDSKGTIVKEEKLFTNPQYIDVSSLTKGFYLIKINNGGVFTTEKFMKL